MIGGRARITLYVLAIWFVLVGSGTVFAKDAQDAERGLGNVPPARSAFDNLSDLKFAVQPVPYDLNRVVERALSHHFGVRLARLQESAAAEQAAQQRGALKPNLSVTARPTWFETPVPDLDSIDIGLTSDQLRDLVESAGDCFDDATRCDDLEDLLDELEDSTQSLADQFAGGSFPQKLQQGRTHAVSLNGSVPVWRSPLQRAMAEAADLQVEMSGVDADQAAAGAVLQSIDAYFAVLRADSALRVAQLSLQESAERLREIESKVQSGTATELDRLQLQAERYGADAGVVQAQGEATAARMTLNTVLGLDLNVPLQLAPPAGAEGAMLSVPFGVNDALRLTAESGDAHKAYTEWRLAGAGAAIAAERAKPEIRFFGSHTWPEVELTLGVDRHGFLGGSVAWSETYLDDGRVKNDTPSSWFAGVEMTWTVFDGGAQRAEVEVARLRTEQAELYYEQVMRTARTEVVTAYVRWQAAQQGLKGAGQGVEAAAEGLDVAKRLAAAGVATRSAVLQAEVGLARAEQGYLEALYGATMAHNAYLHAAGELVPYWHTVLAAQR